MKTGLSAILSVLLISLLVMGAAWAGMGHGGGQGDGAGGGPIHDIFAGTLFDYTGDVGICIPGGGLALETDGVTYYIFGIGPVKFWEDLGYIPPTEGDTIRVQGYTVEINGDERNIATIITVSYNDGSVEVALRDADGRPLWRAARPHPINPPDDENL